MVTGDITNSLYYKLLGNAVDDLLAAPFRDCEAALRFLVRLAGTDPLLVVIDEAPRLLSSQHDFADLVSAVWENRVRGQRLMLVLTGSAVSTMEQMLGAQGGLGFDFRLKGENLGYEMCQSRNSWDDAEYKGINTRWVTEGGQRFEVQFHTPESFHARQYVTHGAYERTRNPLTSDAERAGLEAFPREVSSRIQGPRPCHRHSQLQEGRVLVPDKITFYAVIGGDRTVDNPYGLVRRLEFDGDGFTDEGLRKDFSWAFTPAIVEWKRGDLGQELVEVSHEQFEKIIEYFRERWGPYGQPLDP